MTVHIIKFPQRGAPKGAVSNEPAAVCRERTLTQPFHYWRGGSGRRYLHTVFSLIDCPEMAKANYILVHRGPGGARRALAVGQTVADAASLNLARLRHQGARLGANEIHIHLLAEDHAERDAVAADLRHLGAASPDRGGAADPIRVAS